MNFTAIRSAFNEAAQGQLRLSDQGRSRYDDAGRKILSFSGWHKDETPFAFVTAPFDGDPIERARQIARDLIAAHTGRSTVPAPAPIKGLANTLRQSLTDATDRANRVALKAKDSVANLHTVIDGAESVIQEVDAAAADIQAALGVSTNGGPALEP